MVQDFIFVSKSVWFGYRCQSLNSLCIGGNNAGSRVVSVYCDIATTTNMASYLERFLQV
jgi:hypothetical protein